MSSSCPRRIQKSNYTFKFALYFVITYFNIYFYSDYHRKQNTIKALKRKALDKNPDEFYFNMVKTQKVVCVHYFHHASYSCVHHSHYNLCKLLLIRKETWRVSVCIIRWFWFDWRHDLTITVNQQIFSSDFIFVMFED